MSPLAVAAFVVIALVIAALLVAASVDTAPVFAALFHRGGPAPARPLLSSICLG